MENEASERTGLYLKYRISEVFYNDQVVSRIRFTSDSVNPKSTVERSITLRPNQQCLREVVYLKVTITYGSMYIIYFL